MTRRLTHALAVLYGLTALGLVRFAVVSWNAGAWPHAAILAGASLLLTTAIVHHSWQRDELRAAHAHIERLARPEPAVDGVIAVALAAACCEMWWTSAGAEHEADCRHQQEIA